MGACPVCRAGFRGAAECPRCGADLGPLMALAARAWRQRQAAREALRDGDAARARDLAAKAQRLQTTQAGKALVAVTALMDHPAIGRL